MIIFTHIIACEADQFKCDNGFCIKKYLRCDGRFHCSDRSDEINCNRTLEYTTKQRKHVIYKFFFFLRFISMIFLI